MSLRQDLLQPSRDDVLRALGIDPTLFDRLRSNSAEPDPESHPQLDQAIEMFKARRLPDGEWTSRTYMTVLRSFQGFMANRLLDSDIPVGRISGADIQAFAMRPRRDGVNRHPNTINRDLAVVSAFCRFLVREEHLRRNPAELADRVPEPQSAPRALTDQEQQRLLDLSRKTRNAVRNFTIIHLALNTGLRASEICQLNWADVNLEQGQLHVLRGKGQRSRTVPLVGSVVDSLLYYKRLRKNELACPGHEDSVFLNSTGSRWGCAMTVDGLELMLEPMLRRLKKPKGCSFHLLRHSFAVNLLWRGLHIATIGALLGHRSFETTSKYLRLGDPAVREALTQACPEGVLVPAIRREINRSHLNSLVETVFREDES